MEEKWVKIFSTCDESEVHIVKGILESEGIACRIKSMRVSQFPVTLDGLGEIKIYVLKDDLVRGKEILASYKREE